MYDHIVIRYAEIALKGKNQKDFLNRLIHNIKEQIKTDLDTHRWLSGKGLNLFKTGRAEPRVVF